ncbi:hypothetical protein BC829DRAFT_428311 [Chytridium lagenaria]|nr:hypothetical protein BC829DRAFT_428311 [Chytridium lagenaria]
MASRLSPASPLSTEFSPKSPNPEPGEAAESARNSIVDIPPKLTVITKSSYRRMPWKNGLGVTQEIAIHPPQADYHKVNSFGDSCSLSLFPGYDIALTLLPEDGASLMMRGNMTAPAVLHHNDQELSVPIRPLVPYTYGGETPTSCKVRTPPIRHLSFMANRAALQVSVNLESICPHGLSDDGICDGDGDANTPIPSPHMSHPSIHGLHESQKPKTGPSNPDSTSEGSTATVHKLSGQSRVSPTRKILLAPFTIVYVAVDGGSDSVTVAAGETLVCERHAEAAPTDFAMTPITSKKKKVDVDLSTTWTLSSSSSKSHETPYGTEQQLPRNRHDNSNLPPSLPSQPSPRGRAGSIIIYDDQPLWNLPREMDSSSLLTVKYWESAKHYRPPVFSARYQNESEVPPPIVRDSLVVEEFPVGKISTAYINMVKQGLSEWMRIPVIIARGMKEGKEFVVAVPCVNVSGYLRFSREFSDGKDLNRVFPGSETGTASQVYAHCFLTKIVNCFDYLIDLHTASFGRVNSYYVRSDLNDAVSATLAKLQQPQIILHNSGQDGTLRSAASSRGIKAITVEIGNPQLFQNQYVQWSYLGVMRILAYLNITSSNATHAVFPPPPNTIICSKGFWIYTKTGGVLEEGDLIARIKNIFGNIVDEIYCPSHGVTIGRSSNPVAMAGDRVLHLGIIKKENEDVRCFVG